ncbi:MAG: tol-pal system protein YbgF [Acidimicrobiia bacterium]|nr:tol-pal system protein YbgF [Acidimicrobiia bacterium]
MKTFHIALIALLLIPGAALAQNREHQQLAADVRMLQEQAQQLALTLAAQNQALAEALKAITARLDAQNEAMRKGFADQRLMVDELSDAVGVIRERSDDTNVRITALREELEALRNTVQALQQAALAPPPVVAVPVDPNAPVPTTPQPLPPAPAPAVPSTAGLSPQRLFEPARTDYFAGQYSSAILGFEAFLRAFPRSDLADDAQYYIGESYFQQNQFGDAVTAYNQVIQNYPGANAVPDAYYKRGFAQERLGQADAARSSYETVIKSFPDSTAAQLARQSLDRLARAQKPQ